MKDSVLHLLLPEKKFWKSHGLLWITHDYPLGRDISPTPFCPDCHSCLESKESRSWFCVKCERQYPVPKEKEKSTIVREVHLKWEGEKRNDYEIISLDLPVGKLNVEDGNENFWVKVKVGQRGGKHVMVVYVGEKVGKGQTKEDYVQLFVDLDDEQIRFDTDNRNPTRLLCKLEGEFVNSTWLIRKNDKSR